MLARQLLSIRSFQTDRIVVSEAVKKALNSNKGVVALESTLITHGLPYPKNLETAQLLEEEVRSEGCEPATIAILDHKIHVGLTSAELARVADTMDAVKVSRREIPSSLVQGVVGGTTVAATMLLAHKAGIRVLATGGIGGVHRGVADTFDISADLMELARTPVCVVCAGAKSILDIPKTVEYLETQSIPAIVYDDQNIFPGFYTRTTLSRGQMASTNLEEIAEIIEESRRLGFPAGTLLACPIPTEHEADGKIIEEAIRTAVRMAKEQNISSQQVTPFILKTLYDLTKGASVKTNVALLRNNAKIGARLAKALVKTKSPPTMKAAPSSDSKPKKRTPKIAVIGATILDFEAITDKDVKDDGASYPGQVLQRCGGVGRNHADALARLGCESVLISAVGDDSHAEYFFNKCGHIDLSRIERVPGLPTAVYMSMNVKGEVKYGISSIGPIIDSITPEIIEKNEDIIEQSDFLVLDGNIGVEALAKAMEIAKRHGTPVWFEPTDYHKADKLISCGLMGDVTATSPNANEFRRFAAAKGFRLRDEAISTPERVADFVHLNPSIAENLKYMLVTLSKYGTVAFRRKENDEMEVTFLPPPIESKDIVSVSGSGDSLNAGVLRGIVSGLSWKESLDLGQKCAKLTLTTTEAINPQISELAKFL